MSTIPSKTHWWAPTCMLSALISGAFLAIAHHLFYDGLHDQAVPSGRFSPDIGLSRQQTNIAIGTALAFAFKTCVVIATSTACVQLFWTRVAIEPCGLKLKSINTAYSVTGNFFKLFYLPEWRRFPLLFVLALVAWLIPIASITTPATLSIKSRAVVPMPHKTSQIPGARFDSFSYMAPMISDFNSGPPSFYEYYGPSQALRRLVTAVSTQGSVLPVDSPGLNASYTTTFDAPAIRCSELPRSEQVVIQRNLADYIKTTSCDGATAYRVWFGRLPYITPEMGNPNASTASDPSDLKPTGQTLGVMAPASATFRVAVLPRMLSMSSGESGTLIEPLVCTYKEDKLLGKDTENPLLDLAANSTMLQCALYNATYIVDFSYMNGVQQVSAEVGQADEAILALKGLYGPGETDCSHMAIDDAKAKCEFDLASVRRLSYLAMLDSLLGVIGGTVGIYQAKLDVNSFVTRTTLMDATELKFMSDYAFQVNDASHKPFMQIALNDYGRPDVAGLMDPGVLGKSQSLIQGIEQMFQNMTISLLSTPQFRHDPSSPNAPSVKVSYEAYHNVYVYNYYKLWLAYGIALALSMIAVAVGLYTMVSNNASYSNEFSTILRVGHHAMSDPKLDTEDNGSDPLVKSLAEARFCPKSTPRDRNGVETVGKQFVTVHEETIGLTVALSRRTSQE